MISDISMREDDLCGHTVLIVGSAPLAIDWPHYPKPLV
ncbi:MAG: hypothetical protein CM1200mP39_29720 [Dehalococcoidia bacterium]|nr:MAG: hypothetical protein CM1200mP39_29720 [Dehalococcoidia bacterium]